MSKVKSNVKKLGNTLASIYSVHNRRQYEQFEWFSYEQVKQIREMIQPIAIAYDYHSHRVTRAKELVLSTKSKSNNTKMVFTKNNSDVVAKNHVYQIDDDTQIANSNNLTNTSVAG